ncbi:hypothetical protein D3C87_1665990 [compost metagenome]
MLLEAVLLAVRFVHTDSLRALCQYPRETLTYFIPMPRKAHAVHPVAAAMLVHQFLVHGLCFAIRDLRESGLGRWIGARLARPPRGFEIRDRSTGGNGQWKL